MKLTFWVRTLCQSEKRDNIGCVWFIQGGEEPCDWWKNVKTPIGQTS